MARYNAKPVVPLFEDSVECLFFTSAPETDHSYWVELCSQLNKSIQALSEKYIWQRDKFKVHLPINHHDADDVPYHLASITCFGDNIEDEWFIVHLVLELSRLFKDIIIQIRDNDGDFLLIEAAEYLPSWASPDTTDNRVFIHQNCLHIIPPNLYAAGSKLDLVNAIRIITQSSTETKAVHEVQQSILQRIGNYPDKIQESFHRAIVKVPVDIATLLRLKPALIAHFVGAYCNHDIIDAKACKIVAFEDCIPVTVKFTKCLYAMLTHAKPLKNVKFTEVNDKRSVIGQKLAVGYQILMNKPTADIFSSKQFKNFLNKLNATGYFKNNLEGSAKYNELLTNAKEFYSVLECPINAQVTNEISELMISSDFIQTKATLLQKDLSVEDLIEDEEHWLNVKPDQLNKLLNDRYGKQAKFYSNDVLTANNLTSELSMFLTRTSDFEGIETNNIEESEIEFDPDEFTNSVQKMLDMITLGGTNDEIASDASEDCYESEESDNEELDNINQEQLQDSKIILQNIVQSMKEEGLSGPSSNLMRTIGINKTDFLDSDDDMLQ